MNHTTVQPDGGREQSERKEYHIAVENCVDVIEERLENDPQADLAELVWQQVDSDRYIMYYGYNLHVLNYSDNEPGEWKHLVSDNDDFRSVIQAMAYATMETDIWEEVRERNLDE